MSRGRLRVNNLAFKVQQARRRRSVSERRPAPVVRVVPAAMPVISTTPKRSVRARVGTVWLSFCTAVVVAAGMCAAWGVGVLSISAFVPQVHVVEVARAGVLPRCVVYDRVKGGCND
jgi:hypothetical protein